MKAKVISWPWPKVIKISKLKLWFSHTSLGLETIAASWDLKLCRCRQLMNSIKVCEYSWSRSFHDDLILQDQASGERSQDQWSSGSFSIYFVLFTAEPGTFWWILDFWREHSTKELLLYLKLIIIMIFLTILWLFALFLLILSSLVEPYIFWFHTSFDVGSLGAILYILLKCPIFISLPN